MKCYPYRTFLLSLAMAVALSYCGENKGSPKTWSSHFLEVTAPGFVKVQTQFDAKLRINLPHMPNEKLVIKQKMLFIISQGCSVLSFAGATPVRFSDLLPDEGYANFQGDSFRDPYTLNQEFIQLDSQGKYETNATLLSTSDKSSMVPVGRKQIGCIFIVGMGGLDKVEAKIPIQ